MVYILRYLQKRQDSQKGSKIDKKGGIDTSCARLKKGRIDTKGVRFIKIQDWGKGI